MERTALFGNKSLQFHIRFVHKDMSPLLPSHSWDAVFINVNIPISLSFN
jgi:hypothetical protein